jgi:hypothetical protein
MSCLTHKDCFSAVSSRAVPRINIAAISAECHNVLSRFEFGKSVRLMEYYDWQSTKHPDHLKLSISHKLYWMSPIPETTSQTSDE